MSAQIPEQATEFGRAHPRLMLAATIAAGVIATIVLLASGNGPIILYQAF